MDGHSPNFSDDSSLSSPELSSRSNSKPPWEPDVYASKGYGHMGPPSHHPGAGLGLYGQGSLQNPSSSRSLSPVTPASHLNSLPPSSSQWDFQARSHPAVLSSNTRTNSHFNSYPNMLPLDIGQASHDSLMQAGNRAHSELYHAFLTLEGKYTAVVNAYTTLAQAVPTVFSSTPNVLGLTLPSSSQTNSLPTISTHRVAQLNRNDPKYKNIKYWDRRAWTGKVNTKSDVTDVDQSESSDESEETNNANRYVEDLDGEPISGARAAALRKSARQIWAFLEKTSGVPAHWGDVDVASSTYFRTTMYGEYPELRYCEENWKVDLVASNHYSDWIRNRPAMKKIKKEMILKAELDFDTKPTIPTKRQSKGDGRRVRKKVKPANPESHPSSEPIPAIIPPAHRLHIKATCFTLQSPSKGTSATANPNEPAMSTNIIPEPLEANSRLNLPVPESPLAPSSPQDPASLLAPASPTIHPIVSPSSLMNPVRPTVSSTTADNISSPFGSMNFSRPNLSYQLKSTTYTDMINSSSMIGGSSSNLSMKASPATAATAATDVIPQAKATELTSLATRTVKLPPAVSSTIDNSTEVPQIDSNSDEIIDPLTELFGPPSTAQSSRLSTVLQNTAKASSSSKTKSEPAVGSSSTKKPPKYRVGKAINARNVFGGIWIKNNPHGTTAEFNAAFATLSKEDLEMYDAQAKEVKKQEVLRAEGSA